MQDEVQAFVLNQTSPNTAKMYGYRLRAFARWLEAEHGIVEVQDVTTAHILAYRQSLAHLARTTQANAVVAIRQFFAFCHAQGWIGEDPAKSVKVPRKERGRTPTYLTVEETRRLLEAVDPRSRTGKRDRAILWLLVGAGLRVGEIVALRVGDVIPPENGRLATLHVRGKGSRNRQVPICGEAWKAVACLLEAKGTQGKSLPLFTPLGNPERQMTVRAVEYLFERVCKAAGIPREKAHPHAARHGFGTRLVFSNVPGGLEAVRRLLGHANLSTTQIYLHADTRALEAAIAADPLVAHRSQEFATALQDKVPVMVPVPHVAQVRIAA